jgi:two-component system cell cycle sensor histidine kinase/response regulator CckA
MTDTPPGLFTVAPGLSAAADWLIGLALPVALASLTLAAAAAVKARRVARAAAERRTVRAAVAHARAEERARLAATLTQLSAPAELAPTPVAVLLEEPSAPPPPLVDVPTPAPVGDAFAGLAAALVRPEAPRPEAPPDDPFRAVFDALPHPLWVFDEETLGFVAVNDAAVFKYGYNRDEVLKLTVRDVCPEEDVAALLDASPDSAADGRQTRWRHRTRAGVLLECEATAHRVRFAGRPARVIFAGDGSDRRRTAAALRKSEELLRTIIAHIPCGVFWKDRASIYLGCNDTAAKDFGMSAPGEVVGMTDFELVPDLDEADVSRNCDRQVMESGDPLLNAEECRSRPDGQKAALLTSRVPLRDAAGAVTGVLGVYLDITDRKRLEEQYRQAAKMEAVGRLAGGIAHDFNNLLTVIRGNAEWLAGATGGTEAARMVDEVQQAADRAAGLVRQLLTFSRPQQCRPKVVDLSAVVTDLSAILRRLLGVVHVDVELPEQPVPVLADRGHLEQVVMNLAVNARDAMPTGGRLRLAVGWAFNPAVGRGRLARLSVSDTGVGMSDEVKARIFDPFFTTKGPDKGTGLGLAVVHGIVKQAGGGIEVVSAVGQGTTFHIDLPLTDQAPSGIRVVRETARPSRCGQGRPLLLVEDEDGIRALARLTLEGRGFVVTECPDAEAAIDRLNAGGRFDLLVTDMTMPGLGGRDVAFRATELLPTIRVVYMSGYVPDDDRLAEPPGALFLPKPFTPAELAKVVEDALAARGPAPSGESRMPAGAV